MNIKNQKLLQEKASGFSIIEIMIVLIIIGILSSTAYISYEKFVSKAKQTEAKVNLQTIYSAQKYYFLEKGEYAENFSQLGINNLSTNSRYRYRIISNTDKLSYRIEADANLDSDPETDLWEINEKKELKHTRAD